MDGITVFLTVLVLIVIWGTYIGSTKGRGWTGFLLTFFLGLIGLLIIALIKGDRKDCPFCGRPMPRALFTCSHCGWSIEEFEARRWPRNLEASECYIYKGGSNASPSTPRPAKAPSPQPPTEDQTDTAVRGLIAALKQKIG